MFAQTARIRSRLPWAALQMTLLEAGFNFNHQKSLLRLLRNQGALAALPLHRKIELARFFTGPQLRVSVVRVCYLGCFDLLASWLGRGGAGAIVRWIPAAGEAVCCS